MANYSSNLKTWGDTGAEYPDGYSYLVGEQPVDDWDNFFNYNAEKDIQHLINLTNARLESTVASSDPGTPETGEMVFRTDLDKLRQYDGAAWHTVLFADNGKLEGNFDAANYIIQNVGKLTFPDDGGARTLADMAVSGTPTAGTEESLSLKIDGTDFIKAYAEADGAGGIQNTYVDIPVGTLKVGGSEVALSSELTDISEDGTLVMAGAADINFQGHLNVIDDGDGTVSIDPTHTHALGELSDVTATGEGSGGGFDADMVDGQHASAFATAGHTHALGDLSDVTASGEGSGGGFDADMVDGQHASAFASAGHTHALGDLSNVTATGEGSGGGFDADTVDGKHSSEIGPDRRTLALSRNVQ